MKNSGAVYWITGLAGSGKTTIAKMLVERLRNSGQSVIYLDGDVLRPAISETTSYDAHTRRLISERYVRLCEMLASQGICVVAAFIAMFHDTHDLARDLIEDFRLVFIDVPMEVLQERDQKGLYSQAIAGKIKDVVGVDIEAEFPKEPDLIIKNFGAMSPEKAVSKITDYYAMKS